MALPRITPFFVLFAWLASSVGGGCAHAPRSGPAASGVTAIERLRRDAAWGYSDRTRRRLLAEAPPEGTLLAPVEFTRALCDGGREVSVRFVRLVVKTSQSTHRQTENNFENDGGYLFEATGAQSLSDVCVVTRASSTPALRTLPLVPIRGADPATGVARIEGARHRRVEKAWPLASVPGHLTLVLALYAEGTVNQARAKGDAPGEREASLVLIPEGTDTPLAFEDMRSSGGSWRADGEPELNPREWSVLFAFRAPDGSRGVAVRWAGPEGESNSIRLQVGDRLESVVNGYRYWSPL